ncbi:MAG: AI-2E family transporter [Clostridia bacterium]|nr:AI-2E family transporter [Clostridia bacterium]
MGKLKGKNHIGVFIVAAVVFLFVFASEKMFFVLSVFKPIFVGIMIAYILDVMVRFLNGKLKIKRGIAITLVLIFVVALVAVCSYFAIPFLVDTIRKLINSITAHLIGHDSGINRFIYYISTSTNIDLSDFDSIKIEETLLEFLNRFVQTFSSTVVNRIVWFGSSMVNVLTSIMMAIYMLIEKDSLLKWFRRLIKAVFSENKGNYILGAFTMANGVFKKFIIGKFIDSSIIGVLCLIIFKIFGIEYAVVFSIIIGVGNMIPYFGPIFSAIPVVLILVIINPQSALIALISIIVLQQLDGNVIGPKILSENIGVSAFWILFGVTVCGMAFGFVGMIAGVPLVVVAKNLVEDYVDIKLKQRNTEHISVETNAGVEDAEK